MKTSIFNMTFTLPPMVEMAEVEKEMPTATGHAPHPSPWGPVCVPVIVRRPT